MNMKKRIQLIELLSEELHATAYIYEKVRSENKSTSPGDGEITKFESMTAIKRRITVLRAELLELYKQLD